MQIYLYQNDKKVGEARSITMSMQTNTMEIRTVSGKFLTALQQPSTLTCQLSRVACTKEFNIDEPMQIIHQRIQRIFIIEALLSCHTISWSNSTQLADIVLYDNIELAAHSKIELREDDIKHIHSFREVEQLCKELNSIGGMDEYAKSVAELLNQKIVAPFLVKLCLGEGNLVPRLLLKEMNLE